MSANFGEQELWDWISQAEAARLHGVSRQAISKLVQSGRLRSKSIGGRTLVSRAEVVAFRPTNAGRPRGDELRDVERFRRLLAAVRPEVRRAIFEDMRKEHAIHPLEVRLGIDAEVILVAIERSGELTLRMIRGVIAEAAFEVYVANQLDGWSSEPISGNPAYDFVLDDGNGPVRVQVKLQRSEKGVPKTRKGLYVVETQRTRSGLDQATGESTRPYRSGEFDILAVAMKPAKGDWHAFYYTVADWLVPRAGDSHLLQVYQPVAAEPNDDWTDDFAVCVQWQRSAIKKTIRTFE